MKNLIEIEVHNLTESQLRNLADIVINAIGIYITFVLGNPKLKFSVDLKNIEEVAGTPKGEDENDS